MSRFDLIASKWDTPARIKLSEDILQALFKNVPISTQMVVLELGSGTGLITLPLSEKVKKIIALDTSSEMLKVLNEKISRNSISNIQTRQGELEKQEGGQLDLIFSSMTLHHIQKIEEIIKLFYHKLKPGGWIALADLVSEDGSFHEDWNDVFHQGFDTSELLILFEKSGFKDLQISPASLIEKKGKVYPVFLLTGKK